MAKLPLSVSAAQKCKVLGGGGMEQGGCAGLVVGEGVVEEKGGGVVEKGSWKKRMEKTTKTRNWTKNI